MSERESSQPGGAACRQAGWWSEEGWGGRASGFISYCQPKLVFPEQKCQLVWHVFCLPVFSNTHPDAAAGHLLVPPRRMQKHPRTYTQYGGRSYFHLMLHSVAAHGVVCVRCRDKWNGACPCICLLYSPRLPLGYSLSQPSRRPDL